MSQPRIDQFFKSTSIKREIDGVKITKQPMAMVPSQSTPGRKLPVKKRSGGPRNVRNSIRTTETNEKNTGKPRKVSPKISTESKQSHVSIYGPEASSSGIQDRSPREKSISAKDNISGINSLTPGKKTIKNFVAACNSPKATPTPNKITLCHKRRNEKSPEAPSPPKKPSCSEVLEPQVSSTSPENLDENFDNEIEIVDIVTKNDNEIKNNNSLNEKENVSNIQRIESSSPLENLDEYFEHEIEIAEFFIKDDNEMKNNNNSLNEKENESNIQRNNVKNDNRHNSDKVETKVAPKKRKTLDSSSSRKSASSRWKVAVSIETPDRSMTALSSDWQKTLANSTNLANSFLNGAEGASNVNKKSMTKNRDNGDVSKSCSPTRENTCDSFAKQSSPRRALFSPESSTKKLCVEDNVLDKSPAAINPENSVASQRNEAKMSPQGISKSTELSTNGNLNSNEKIKINEAKTSPQGISKSSDLRTNGNFSSNENIAEASNSENKIVGASEISRESPSKKVEILATPTKSSFRGSRSSFSPRVKFSPQKPYKERVDTDLATKVVDNLNQAKQGIIPPNDFDLELIYVKKKFDFEYGSLNANAAVKYEARDVRAPKDKHADHFFMVLVNVFSEPLNCGYFDDDELDIIFSILTLRSNALSLLVRMLKRRRGWHRVSNIKYPEISEHLEPIFRELVNRGFLQDDVAEEEISVSLSLLQVEEVRSVCQAMKVKPKSAKPSMISDLVKLSKRSLFPGIKTPAAVLREKVSDVLGHCIRLSERIENLLNRIFILLIPTQEPGENMVEAFRMLAQVHFGEKRFPTTLKQRFPIFRNRSHLIGYAEAKSAWNQIVKATEDKDWEAVIELGHSAYKHLRPYFERDDSSDETETSTLPSHVKRFDANYAWTKVMSISVEGFKKTKDMATAAELLRSLLSRRNKIPGNRTRWYSELALIESYHLKNVEGSAEITIEALMQEKLSEIDAAELFERARKLGKSKALSAKTKDRINMAVSLKQEMFISSCPEPTIKEIEATMIAGNTTGSKSMWSMNIGDSDIGYLRVEEVALHHYLGQGYRDGVHCEGGLPVTIFATLLWDEIYSIPVPGAFVSPYQTAPLDLYTSQFFESRRERIEEKLKTIRRLDLEYLSSIMQEDFDKYRDYNSLMHGNLFSRSEDFKNFIKCMGMDAVVGICERLAGNYNQWKSGFPDLAIWNPDTKKCKIVEVKGPGDTLSTKQRLWIQFLDCLGVEVEVCVVKKTTKRYVT